MASSEKRCGSDIAKCGWILCQACGRHFCSTKKWGSRRQSPITKRRLRAQFSWQNRSWPNQGWTIAPLSLKTNRASLQVFLSWNTPGEIAGLDYAATFAGIGSRAVARLRKYQSPEGRAPQNQLEI